MELEKPRVSTVTEENDEKILDREQNNGSEQEETREPEDINWQDEAKKNEDLYLRASAELENTRRRLEKEKQDSVKFANETLIKDLLPVLDNLDRALEHAEAADANNESIIEGVRMTRQSFIEILERFGLKSVNALGEKFDPNFHEAVMQQENPDVEEGTVIQQIQIGYMLKDRLIRPAMVVVSRKG